jgi:hypothetical protein
VAAADIGVSVEGRPGTIVVTGRLAAAEGG